MHDLLSFGFTHCEPVSELVRNHKNAIQCVHSESKKANNN